MEAPDLKCVSKSGAQHISHNPTIYKQPIIISYSWMLFFDAVERNTPCFFQQFLFLFSWNSKILICLCEVWTFWGRCENIY